MFVICNGMPRSASTWSFNVVKELLSDFGRKGFYGYDEDLYRFCSAAPAEARDLVVKCHSLDSMGLALVRNEAAKLVFTFRDPVDATASFMEMFEPNFERALTIIKIGLDLMAQHRRHGNWVFLDYAEILENGAKAVQSIAAYLGLAMTTERIDAIADHLSLDRMRERLRDIESLDYGPKLVRHAYGLYDPVTLLNVQHIRDGGLGYGRERLSAEKIARIEALVRDCAAGGKSASQRG